jgi:hypothetical protein
MNSDLFMKLAQFGVVAPVVINRLAPRFIPVPLLEAARQLAVKKARRTGRAAGRRKFRSKIEC